MKRSNIGLKTTEAQRRANKAYRERNKEKALSQGYRSSAKTFARHHARSIDELLELVEIFKNENPNYKGE